jgi:hypothetical protein
MQWHQCLSSNKLIIVNVKAKADDYEKKKMFCNLRWDFNQYKEFK